MLEFLSKLSKTQSIMKKVKIKPYLYQLIKENILYIIFSFGFLMLSIFLVQTSIAKILILNQKSLTAKREVSELKKRFDLLNTIVPSTEELEQDIKILNALIPNVEDYFSIIYALDKLSQDTGFIITSYDVNMKKSTADKLKLTISGIGNTADFVNFLGSYNFSGGRLITSDKIELSTNTSGQIKIDLTFYNKKINTNYNQNIPVNQKVFEDITVLKSKINFVFNDQSASETANIDTSYPVKSSLF